MWLPSDKRKWQTRITNAANPWNPRERKNWPNSPNIESENQMDAKRDWKISWTVQLQAAKNQNNTHPTGVAQKYISPGQKCVSTHAKNRKQREKKQPKRTRKGPESKATNTSLAASGSDGSNQRPHHCQQNRSAKDGLSLNSTQRKLHR